MRGGAARRGRALLCALAMGVGVLPLAGAPAFADAERGARGSSAEAEPSPGRGKGDASSGGTSPGDASPARYVVTLVDEPVASYRGGKQGLAATRPDRAKGQRRLDPDSPASRAYARHLERERERTVDRIERRLGRGLEVEQVYELATNGLATSLTAAEAALVADVPGVATVAVEEVLALQTDAGPALIGAPQVWESTDPALASQGAGVVVGILDSGVAASNPSFAGTGPLDAQVHVNPRADGRLLGVCDPDQPAYDATFPCNGKLLGAWDFTRGQDDPANDARDSTGHGSHVASTVAGNRVEAVLRPGPAASATVTRRISGVAPHAHLVSYKVCDGGCPASAILAGVDQSVRDGVDVLNYSISAADISPWVSSITLAFLRAQDAGITVVTSAGNNGPGAGSVSAQKGAPWTTSVGASTHGRRFVKKVTGFTGGEDAPGDLTGVGISTGVGPAGVVDVLDVDPLNRLCGRAFAADAFAGAIAVCDSGLVDFREKAARVREAGGVGIIVVNTTAAESLFESTTVEPLVHLGVADGAALRAWLDRGTDHQASISAVGAELDEASADVLAGFSSRGPVRELSLLAPHVTAPGASILAAGGVGDPATPVWELRQGTSMASPHVAGASALLRALHPDWSPSQLRSALMTTATPSVLDEPGGTPLSVLEQGTGRIDVAAASTAGLLLHEAGFAAADPATGGDPRALNLPELVDRTCAARCSWQRTLTATRDGAWTIGTASRPGMALTVEPAGPVALREGESVTVTVTASVDASSTTWRQGVVTLSAAGVPTTRLTVAALPARYSGPTSVTTPTRRDAGSHLVRGVRLGVEGAVARLALATVQERSSTLVQDPTHDHPFDDLGQVWWTTVAVPDVAQQLTARIGATTARDLDLFVGRGATPSHATRACSSINTGNADSCAVADPAPGTWWVLVQSYEASAAAPDAFAALLGLVGPGSAQTVELVPAAAGEPRDLRLRFDHPLQEGQSLAGLLTLGTSDAAPADLARIPVTVDRLADDVVAVSDSGEALPGQEVEHTITVRPNVRPEPTTHTITETLPPGTTYVEGSATGGATVVDGVLRWTGTSPAAGVPQQDTVLTYRSTVDVPHTRGTVTSSLTSVVDDPAARPVTVSRSLDLVGCYEDEGLELDAALLDGPAEVARGERGEWTVLLSATACQSLREVVAQGGTSAAFTTTASTDDGTIAARKVNKRNSVLQWRPGDRADGTTARARLSVAGTVGKDARCGSLVELTGAWSATARDVADDAVASPVTVRVRC